MVVTRLSELDILVKGKIEEGTLGGSVFMKRPMVSQGQWGLLGEVLCTWCFFDSDAES